jgi:molecular chaperone Hsp33
MPGVDDDTIDEIEHRVQQLPQISTMINEGLSPEEMLEKIFPGRLSLIGRLPLRFSCFCSHERVESVLRSLGAEELQSMLDEDGEAEVVCHFCNEKYHFNRDDLEALIQQLNDAN